MNRTLGRATFSAVIALAVFTLTGCAASSPDAAVTSAIPAAIPTPTPIADMGDVVAKTDADGNPVIITDSAGSYTHVTIRPDSKAMTVDPSTVQSTVAEGGWSAADILSGQQWVARFEAEQGIDSIAVDSPTGWDEWKATQASNFIAPEWSAMLEKPGDNSDRPSIIANNPNNALTSFIRDGAPRVSDSEIRVLGVASLVVGSQNNLVVSGTYTTKYRVTDEAVLQSFRNKNPTKSDAEITAQRPNVGDGIDDPVTFDGEFKFSIEKDVAHGWLLTGFFNSFTVSY